MAIALVTAIRSGGQRRGDGGSPAPVIFIATCYFAGSDVSDEIEGQAYSASVDLYTDYTPASLKTAMVAAVVARGAELGLTVANTDVYVPVYEAGV